MRGFIVDLETATYGVASAFYDCGFGLACVPDRADIGHYNLCGGGPGDGEDYVLDLPSHIREEKRAEFEERVRWSQSGDE